MRRDPGLLFIAVAIGVVAVAIKESKPVARRIGKFLVKAGEDLIKASEAPEKPPVAQGECGCASAEATVAETPTETAPTEAAPTETEPVAAEAPHEPEETPGVEFHDA